MWLRWKIYENQIDWNDNLPLNKTIGITIVAIVIRAVFHENHIYYGQVFLDEFLYKIKMKTKN